MLNGEKSAVALEAIRFILFGPLMISWFQLNPIWHFVSILIGLYLLQCDTYVFIYFLFFL